MDISVGFCSHNKGWASQRWLNFCFWSTRMRSCLAWDFKLFRPRSRPYYAETCEEAGFCFGIRKKYRFFTEIGVFFQNYLPFTAIIKWMGTETSWNRSQYDCKTLLNMCKQKHLLPMASHFSPKWFLKMYPGIFQAGEGAWHFLGLLHVGDL